MKPHVICHMVTSTDGRILTKRWGKIPGPKTPSKLYETTAESFGIGAWLVGTTTMAEFADGKSKLPSARGTIERTDHVADPKARTFAIGTDRKGVLRFAKGDASGDHIVVLVTERVSNDYLAHLRAAKVSYLFCGKKHVDLALALDKIRRVLKIRELLLEGGGTFNGAMLDAGLVDEISQIVLPVVDGGTGVATIFDIPGKAPKKAAGLLELKKVKKLASDAVWLRWVVKRKKR